MLVDFITAHRAALITMTRAKVVKRLAPMPTERELVSGVGLFLDELAETLRRPPSVPAATIKLGAAAHGAELLRLGYTVSQVVHDYGDICQAVTELAAELDAPITTDEFHTLNRCLDNAIAEAVTEYTSLRDRSMTEGQTERSGVFAHELRNRIASAQLAFSAIRSGRAPVAGSVAAVVMRNLDSMTRLIHRALVEVRLDLGDTRRSRILLHQVLDEAEIDGAMEAGARGVALTVSPADPRLEVDADPQLLAGAIANILQNAFKFTPSGGSVSMKTRVFDRRVAIDIEDGCGGLAPGKVSELFTAFQHRGTDQEGLGLGLFISRRGVEACGGVIQVRDVPGNGCVFTIDLPLAAG